MKFSSFALVLCALTAGALAGDEDLKKRIEDEHARGADHWVYNDIGAAIEVARRENKPLFVTFRCVPCKACSSFDAEVARGSEVIRKLAKEKFVSVRQVEMKNVDLNQFQFDYDLNWASMFINPDGTVYARYGTQSADGPDAFNSVEGLEQTMRRVLQLHADYPNNKQQFVGKRGTKKPYVTAIDMPGLPNDKNKFLAETTRRNCIHCHMIHDAENEHAQKSGSFTQDSLWRYPLPDNVGIQIDPRDGLTVRKVSGAAASAGLKVGDRLTHMDGQVLTSIADMQWVLHHLPNKPVDIMVRTAAGKTFGFKTKPDWKRYDISWRGSMWSISPRMNVWAPELPAEKREALGIGRNDGALEVRWINRGAPGGRAAFEAGLRQGDVIVALDGKDVPNHPTRFQLHIKLNYKVGDRLPLTVLRNGRKKQISVELVH